jgi:hypothetical protein
MPFVPPQLQKKKKKEIKMWVRLAFVRKRQQETEHVAVGKSHSAVLYQNMGEIINVHVVVMDMIVRNPSLPSNAP